VILPWQVSGSAQWDHKDIDGRWQRLWESHRVFFGPFDELVKTVSDETKCELEVERVDEKVQATHRRKVAPTHYSSHATGSPSSESA
jgi:hypothetical protein